MAAPFDVVHSAAEFARGKKKTLSCFHGDRNRKDAVSQGGSGSRGPTRLRRPWRSAIQPDETARVELAARQKLAEAVLHCAGRDAGALKEIYRARGTEGIVFSRRLFAFQPCSPWLGVRLSISLGWTQPRSLCVWDT